MTIVTSLGLTGKVWYVAEVLQYARPNLPLFGQHFTTSLFITQSIHHHQMGSFVYRRTQIIYFMRVVLADQLGGVGDGSMRPLVFLHTNMFKTLTMSYIKG